MVVGRCDAEVGTSGAWVIGEDGRRRSGEQIAAGLSAAPNKPKL